MTRHDDAAALLLAVRRREAARLDDLPQAVRPETEAEAYAIQRAIVAQLGEIAAWKVGSPSPVGDRFTSAPIPTGALFDGPVAIEGSDHVVEAEIAVRLGRDLPPREAPYTEADIRAAIASAHPALEVLETRFVNADAVGAFSGLADSLSNHSLVVGPAIPDWQSVDLGGETVRVLADGREIARGAGNPGGELMRLLLWLANVGARWAGGLKAGQVVTTGSWTGKNPIGPAQEVVAEFAHCGSATLRFAS